MTKYVQNKKIIRIVNMLLTIPRSKINHLAVTRANILRNCLADSVATDGLNVTRIIYEP